MSKTRTFSKEAAPAPLRSVTFAEARAELAAQGVSTVNWAFVCPVCGTVQSLRSLHRAGASAEQARRLIGFSCEGRLTDAGAWPSSKDTSAKANTRRSVRGCDWSLGGLLRIHRLEVSYPEMNGQPAHTEPSFELATSAQAIELKAKLDAGMVYPDGPELSDDAFTPSPVPVVQS